MSFTKDADNPKVPATTVILFCVKVPVLSEHTVVAFPIVSQADKTRTRLLSFNIRVVAKARASVTANGKPSGTATTITVTVEIIILTKLLNADAALGTSLRKPTKYSINSTINISKAAAPPNFAICSARSFNFIWRGVSSASFRNANNLNKQIIIRRSAKNHMNKNKNAQSGKQGKKRTHHCFSIKRIHSYSNYNITTDTF